MYKLGDGGPDSCNFDFSCIPGDLFDKFFGSLPNFIWKACSSIRFSLDLNIQSANDRTPPDELESSIYYTQQHFSHWLFKILNETVPKSRTLKSLSLTHIHIPNHYFKGFIMACSRSSVLDSLEIQSTSISDEQAAFIFQKLSPFQLKDLILIDCRIPPSVFEDVSTFLHQPPPDDVDWQLQTLDLTDNFFSAGQFNQIQGWIQKRRAGEPIPMSDSEIDDDGGEYDRDEEEEFGEPEEEEDGDWDPEEEQE
jgi:hypothetical protein